MYLIIGSIEIRLANHSLEVEDRSTLSSNSRRMRRNLSPNSMIEFRRELHNKSSVTKKRRNLRTWMKKIKFHPLLNENSKLFIFFVCLAQFNLNLQIINIWIDSTSSLNILNWFKPLIWLFDIHFDIFFFAFSKNMMLSVFY